MIPEQIYWAKKWLSFLSQCHWWDEEVGNRAKGESVRCGKVIKQFSLCGKTALWRKDSRLLALIERILNAIQNNQQGESAAGKPPSLGRNSSPTYHLNNLEKIIESMNHARKRSFQ